MNISFKSVILFVLFLSINLTSSANFSALEAANALGNQGIIQKQDTASGYLLDYSISRVEMLKVMMNLSSVEVTDTCEGKFSDLPASNWGCKYAEAALKAGFIAANPKFRPADAVTAAEALKMIMQAKGFAKVEGVNDWKEAYLLSAIQIGLVDEVTTLASGPAKRSTVFIIAASALQLKDEGESILVDAGDKSDNQDIIAGSGTFGSTITLTFDVSINMSIQGGSRKVGTIVFVSQAENNSLSNVEVLIQNKEIFAGKQLWLEKNGSRITSKFIFDSSDPVILYFPSNMIFGKGAIAEYDIIVE